MEQNCQQQNLDEGIKPEISRFEFVGRDQELATIQSALADPAIRLINISGAGGIGKTSILQKIKQIFEKDSDCCVTRIIDFFDISVNTAIGFMNRLIDSLPGKTDTVFQPYFHAEDRVIQMEMAGLADDFIREEHDRLEALFNECLNQFCEKRRCIILMDTFEESGQQIRDWLMDWIPGIDKAVCVIAGRPSEHWQNRLSHEAGASWIKGMELEPLDMASCVKLARCSQYGQQADEEELEKLKILSGGFPILLILAVDKTWPRRKTGASGIQKTSTRTSGAYSLETLRSMSPDQLETVKQEFREELVHGVLNMIQLQPCAIVILYMALLSRYFTAEIHAHLEPVELEQAGAVLAGFETWAFMKHDPETGTYRLHDVIRDLVLDYAWGILDPAGEKRKNILEKVLAYYDDHLIPRVVQEERDIKKELDRERIRIGQEESPESHGEKPWKSMAQYRKLHEIRSWKWMFQAQQVYYQIQLDLETGLQAWQLLFEGCLWIKDPRALTMLKRELRLALSDIRQSYPKCLEQLDNAREQVLLKRDYDAAIQMLDQIDIVSKPPQTDYLHAVRWLYRGIANSFLGKSDLAEQDIQRAIELLETLELDLKPDRSQDQVLIRAVKRAMARAHGSVGFANMMVGQLAKAEDAYSRALKYSKGDQDMATERSYHLNDMGYVQACLGRFDRARFFCQQGLKLRQELGSEFLVGLSHNTLGLIAYMADEPRSAKTHCDKAMAVFEAMGDTHSIGLAHRALGGILSRIADQEDSQEHLETARRHLLKALDHFIHIPTGRLLAPIYAAETFLRMGMMYTTWKRLAMAGDVDEEQIQEFHRKARYCFQRCIKEFKRANAMSRLANARGRLADFYLDAGEMDEAEKEIAKMEQALNQCQCNLSDISEKGVLALKDRFREFLHPAARLLFLKARINMMIFRNQGDTQCLESAASLMVAGYACMIHFSSEAFDVVVFLKRLSQWLNSLDAGARDKLVKRIQDAITQYPKTDFSKLMDRLEDSQLI